MLTCDPGEELYSLFGHTALRLIDKPSKIDIVFNYGIFSFEAENFIYNFARGYTDYQLATQSFQSFMREYRYDDRTVIQSEIALDSLETERLFQLLLINMQPENKIYRYNYFTNNCASKIRDIVEEAKSETLQYPDFPAEISYREAVKPYMEPFPWVKLGTDLLLGAPADSSIHYYTMMFLPDYLNSGLALTQTMEGSLIVKQETIIEGAQRPVPKMNIQHPTILFLIFLFIVAALSWLELKSKINLRIFDGIFFIVLGIGGILTFFISFISIHPTVFPNIHILWLTPTHLIAAIVLFKKKRPQWMIQYCRIFSILAVLSLIVLISGLQTATFSVFPLLISYGIRVTAIGFINKQ